MAIKRFSQEHAERVATRYHLALCLLDQATAAGDTVCADQATDQLLAAVKSAGYVGADFLRPSRLPSEASLPITQADILARVLWLWKAVPPHRLPAGIDPATDRGLAYGHRSGWYLLSTDELPDQVEHRLRCSTPAHAIGAVRGWCDKQRIARDWTDQEVAGVVADMIAWAEGRLAGIKGGGSGGITRREPYKVFLAGMKALLKTVQPRRRKAAQGGKEV